VEPEKEARLGSFVSIVEGRQLGGADTYGVLLGQGVARALKLVPGDYMTVLANTPDGALNSMEFQVVGVFRSFSKEYDERTIRISLAAAQDLIATEGVHSLVFLLKNTMKTDVVAQRLHDTLSLDSYEVKRWYELADFYRKTVDLYRRQFGILQIIISIMVLLTVANSVNMAIYERTGEFGTLQALGNTQGQVFRLILVEYSLLGLIGAGLGVILGVFLAWVISEIGISMPPPPNSDIGYIAHIRIVSKVVSLGFLVGFIATVLASLLPASRAARIPVVDALRANI
jgi:putative ABC transport system permease protein